MQSMVSGLAVAFRQEAISQQIVPGR